MTQLSLKESVEAKDELCKGCETATINMSDLSPTPCLAHELMYRQRTYPVIHVDNFYDGEWTHIELSTQGIREFLEAIIGEARNFDGTYEEFMENLNPTVVQMTKEDFEKIPEL